MLLCLLFAAEAFCRGHRPRRHHRVDSRNKRQNDIEYILAKLNVRLQDAQAYETAFLATAQGLKRFVWARHHNKLLKYIRRYIPHTSMALDRRATWLPVFNDVRTAAGRVMMSDRANDIINVLLCFIHAHAGRLELRVDAETQIRYNPAYGRFAVAMYYLARQALPNAPMATTIQGLTYKLMCSVLMDLGGARLMRLDDDALFHHSAWLKENLPPKNLKLYRGSEALIEMQQVISGLAGSLMSLNLRFDLMKSVLSKPYPLAYALAKTSVIARNELFSIERFKTCLAELYKAHPGRPVRDYHRGDMDDPVGAAHFVLKDDAKCVSQVTTYDDLCRSICDKWKEARYATKEAREWIKTKDPETLFGWPI